MKSLTILVFALIFGFVPQSIIAAPVKSHSHEGRVHSHQLPATGIKHFHKHMHNGRAHIHPYSDEIGFKHTHDNPRDKAGANDVRHDHGGRYHSHLLPLSGVKHQHQHQHGGRIHLHPLPVNGANHFHQTNKSQSNTNSKEVSTKSKDLNYKQQMAKLLEMSSPKKSKAKKDSALLLKALKSIKKRKVRRKIKRKTKKSTKKTKRKKQKLAVKKKSQNLKKVVLKQETDVAQQELATLEPQDVADGDRQFNIALRYERGTGVQINLPQAFNWYQRAANNGNASAQYNLASLYERGEGITRDMEQAKRWFLTAAENDNTSAQIVVGDWYARGVNFSKNTEEAVKWYKRAADLGDMRGKANLNYLIKDNNGAINR